METNDKKMPVVRIDKSLDKYAGKVLFPKKVEEARLTIEKFGMPKVNKKDS